MLHAVSKKWHLIIMIMVLVLVTTPLLTACGGDDDEEDNAGVVSETGSEKPVVSIHCSRGNQRSRWYQDWEYHLQNQVLLGR